MKKDKPCRTRLLEDLPAQADSFGVHERVADAIVDLVSHEEGRKSIALTGSWGSGKSTVVELLKKKLNRNDSVARLFVFDAWAHQGDPLRRTFLETMIRFFSCEGTLWCKEERWQQDLDRLTKRREDIETRSEPILTTAGKLVALCILLVPLGYTLFGKYSIFVPGWERVICILGLIMSLSPFLVVVFMWLLWRPTRNVFTRAFWLTLFTKSFWLTHRHPHNGESLTSVFIAKNREVVKSHTIKTPDPTSLEFQEIFRKVISEILKESERKLIIVIDNLDRIDPGNALSIWATMRTFFDLAPDSGEDWQKRLWLIVPFDTSALSRLWNYEADKNITKELVQAFTDKSFQVRFDVSLPVLSTWKAFLDEQLRIALPDHDPDDFHSIYLIYRLRGMQDRLPTPRDIKLYINSIGALHRQWQDEISLPAQALYVLMSKDEPRFDEKLSKEEFLEPYTRQIVSLVGDDYREALAAIHFNVPKEKALQVLMGQFVRKALSEGNIEELKERENIPGFAQVIEHVIGEDCFSWIKAESPTIAITAYTLSQIMQQDDPSLQRSWKLLCDSASNTESWYSFDHEVGNGIVQLIKRRPQVEFLSKIIGALSKSPAGDQKEGQAADPGKISSWLEGVIEVLKTVIELGQTSLAKEYFSVNGSASIYVSVISSLANMPRAIDLQTFFKPAIGTKRVMEELVRIVGDGKFDEGHLSGIKVMLRTDQDWPWPELVNSLNGRLQGTNNLTPVEIRSSLFTLVHLKNYRVLQAEKSLETLATKGHLMHHLYQATASKDTKAITACIFPLIEKLPNGSIQQQIGNSAAGVSNYSTIMNNPNQYIEVLKEFTRLAIDYSRINALFEISNKAPNTTKFISAVFEEIAKEENAHQLLTAQQIINHYSFICAALSRDTFDYLILQSIKLSSLREEIISIGFNKQMVSLCTKVFQCKTDQGGEAFRDFLAEGLRSVDKDTWCTELTDEGELLRLLLDLAESGYDLGLTTSFLDALENHAQQLLEGKASVKQLSDKWALIPNVLEPNSKKTFLRNLRDRMCIVQTTLDAVCALYGDYLANSGVLQEKADEVVRKLFKGIIDRKGTVELNWLTRVIGVSKNVFEKCPDESKRDFETRVQNAFWQNDLSEEVRLNIRKIAESLGVDLVKKESQAEDDASKKTDQGQVKEV